MSEVAAIQVASLSDVGRKRQSNQDHCGEFSGAAGERLLVLCDGMGGHQGGEVASQLAVAAIGEFVAAGGAPPEELLRAGFAQAHERLRARAREDPSLRGMGTTAVALLSDGGEAVWVAHTGDSRAYRIRDGKIRQLTEDHSVVAEQLRRGLVTPAEAKGLPHNELLHAIGASTELRVDVARHELRSGDRYVLCSDGLWNFVEEREMVALVLELQPQTAAQRLVDLANEREANDNVTVQVFAFGPCEAGHRLDDDDEGAHAVTQTPLAAAASVDEIWAHTRDLAQARRRRSIRLVAAATALVAIALTVAMMWLSHTRRPEAIDTPPGTDSGERLP